MSMRAGWVVSVVTALGGCTVAGPIENLEAQSSSSSGGAGDGASAHGEDGHSSMTGNATGVTATSTSAGTSATTSGFTTGADPTASDTGTTTGTSVPPLEQCGIELPPGGGNYEAGCSCETCTVYYTDIDEPTFAAIIEACECLCDAAGCGPNDSGEAAAAADSSEAEEAGSVSDSTASSGTESSGNGSSSSG